eukprot:1558147-Pyramimonas_sp.AAC.1
MANAGFSPPTFERRVSVCFQSVFQNSSDPIAGPFWPARRPIAVQSPIPLLVDALVPVPEPARGFGLRKELGGEQRPLALVPPHGEAHHEHAVVERKREPHPLQPHAVHVPVQKLQHGGHGGRDVGQGE